MNATKLRNPRDKCFSEAFFCHETNFCRVIFSKLSEMSKLRRRCSENLQNTLQMQFENSETTFNK